MTEILHKEESHAILGACFEVYTEKGNGFTEPSYQECLEIEFAARHIPFLSQPELPHFYKGRKLKHTFRPDFICYDSIIVEIKALPGLVDEHRSQVLNYLHASGRQLGLLVNFGHFPKVEHERIALSHVSRVSRAPLNP